MLLLIIVNRWKKPKCSLMKICMNKMCYMHMMEYYPIFKRTEILTHATEWMNLEDIVQNEISHKKDKYCMNSPI